VRDMFAHMYTLGPEEGAQVQALDMIEANLHGFV